MKLRIVDRLRCILTGQTLATLDHKRELQEIEAKRAAARAEFERQQELARYKQEQKEQQERLELEKEAANTKEVFSRTKSATSIVDTTSLAAYKRTIEDHIASFTQTGQLPAKAKAEWLLSLIDKEQELLKMGFNRFVSRAKVARFVREHKTRAIQIVSAADYLRVIPDEAKNAIEKTKHIFNDFVIVFTDHSIRAKAAAVRKQPDPILFGIFSAQVSTSGEVYPIDYKPNGISAETRIPMISDRMYFLADWEDEKCDLTFDQMLEESKGMGIDLTAKDIREMEDAMSRMSGMVSL